MTATTDTSDSLDPIFVSVKQMAQMLGLSTWVAYTILNEQQVKSRYVGRRRLVELKSLREYAANLPEYPAEESA